MYSDKKYREDNIESSDLGFEPFSFENPAPSGFFPYFYNTPPVDYMPFNVMEDFYARTTPPQFYWMNALFSPPMDEMMTTMNIFEDLDSDLNSEYERFDSERVDMILSRIEKEHPTVFKVFQVYRIPYFMAKKIIRKIISITLRY